MRYFTYYWNAAQLRRSDRELEEIGSFPIDYTGGSGFAARGIAAGDLLYILNWQDGELLVVGRLEVAQVLDRSGAASRGGPLYDAPEHVLGREMSCTPVTGDSFVPAGDLDEIEFLDGQGGKLPPKRSPTGEIEPQTFRNVREVSSETAERFDDALGFSGDQVFGGPRTPRVVYFELFVSDDDGTVRAFDTEMVCESTLILPRDIELPVSVEGAIPDDVERLTAVVKEAIDRWCDLVPAVVVDDSVIADDLRLQLEQGVQRP